MANLPKGAKVFNVVRADMNSVYLMIFLLLLKIILILSAIYYLMTVTNQCLMSL